MTFLSEEQIHFVGMSSYKETDDPTNKELLRKIFSEIKNIVDTTISEKHYSNPIFKVVFDVDDNDPNLTFTMNYPDYDISPDESIKAIGKEVLQKVSQYVEVKYEESNDFYFEMMPNWSGGWLSYYLYIRPNRGYFECPVCKSKIEDDDGYCITNSVNDERIVMCYNTEGHNTLFVENLVNSIIFPESNEVADNIHVHKVIPSNRTHALLAFQLSHIAQNDYRSFRSLFFKGRNPSMYIITENGIPAGYIFWNDLNDNKRCLRQVFVRDSFRKKNLGTFLVEKTIEIESKDCEFVIESPNELSFKILLKLGFAKINGKYIELIGCTMCSCG